MAEERDDLDRYDRRLQELGYSVFLTDHETVVTYYKDTGNGKNLRGFGGVSDFIGYHFITVCFNTRKDCWTIKSWMYSGKEFLDTIPVEAPAGVMSIAVKKARKMRVVKFVKDLKRKAEKGFSKILDRGKDMELVNDHMSYAKRIENDKKVEYVERGI